MPSQEIPGRKWAKYAVSAVVIVTGLLQCFVLLIIFYLNFGVFYASVIFLGQWEDSFG